MERTIKWMAAAAAFMSLAACSGESETASMTTKVQQLSRVEWTEMTSAPTAAVGTNNNLIMMR